MDKKKIPKQFAKLYDLLKEYLTMLRTCRIKLHLKTKVHSCFSYFQYLFFQLALVEAKLSITDDKLLNSAKEVTLLISLNSHTFFWEKKNFPL